MRWLKTLQNIKEALEFHIETLVEDGEDLPITSSLEKHLSNGEILLDDDIVIAYINIHIPENELV